MTAKSTRSQGVVVITDHRDAHLPFVERHLTTPLIVIDPRQVITGKNLTYTFPKDKLHVAYNGKALNAISGVWFRKPGPIDPEELPVPEAYKLYSKMGLQRLADSLYVAFEDALWVSDYYSILRAENKVLQLALARRLGFCVPETIITSDKLAAQRFLESRSRSVVKPLTVRYPVIDNKSQLFFTTVLGAGHLPDLTNLHLAPAIFQEAVQAVADVRVTVVGGEVFAATIRPRQADRSSDIQDFRFSSLEGGVIIERHDSFPAELAKRCLKLNTALSLNYGAFDFVLDDQGVYWFLENNPNGQWAFVEQDTGLPIGNAIAELLMAGKPI